MNEELVEDNIHNTKEAARMVNHTKDDHLQIIVSNQADDRL